jgi:anti-sigma regulatory factor (Ser/Thr protein kinase)
MPERSERQGAERCLEHRAVAQASTGGVHLDLSIDAGDPDVCRTARAAVRRALGADEALPTRDDVVLVASELVANAVRHGRPPVRLLVQGDSAGTLVAVSDRSHRPPVLRREKHRGLNLVSAVSGGRWGVSLGDVRKCIWAKVPSAAASAGP